jgi:hypothetical protein
MISYLLGEKYSMKIKRSELTAAIKEELVKTLAEQTEEEPVIDPNKRRWSGYGLPGIRKLPGKKQGYVLRGANLYESENQMIDDMRKQGIAIPVIQSHALIHYNYELKRLKTVYKDQAVRDAIARTGGVGMAGAPPLIDEKRLETEAEARARLDIELRKGHPTWVFKNRWKKAESAVFKELTGKDFTKSNYKKYEQEIAEKLTDKGGLKEYKRLVKKKFEDLLPGGTRIAIDPFTEKEIYVTPTVDEGWSFSEVMSRVVTGAKEWGMEGQELHVERMQDDDARLLRMATKEQTEFIKNNPNWVKPPISWNLKIDSRGRVMQEILGARAKHAVKKPGGYYYIDRSLPENHKEFYVYRPNLDRYVKTIVVRDVEVNEETGELVRDSKTKKIKEVTTHIMYYLDQESYDKVRELLRDQHTKSWTNEDIKNLKIAAAVLETSDEGLLPEIEDKTLVKEIEYYHKTVSLWLKWLRENTPEFVAEVFPDGMPQSIYEFEQRWRGDLNLRARLFVYMLPKTISIIAEGLSKFPGFSPSGGPVSRKGVREGNLLKRFMYLLEFHNSLPEGINLIGKVPNKTVKVLEVVRIQHTGTGVAPRRGVTFGGVNEITGPLDMDMSWRPASEPGQPARTVNLPAVQGDIVIVEYGKYVPEGEVPGGQNRQRVALFRQLMPNGTYRWLEGGAAIDRGWNIAGPLPGESTAMWQTGRFGEAQKLKLSPRIEIAKNVKFLHRFFWQKLGNAVINLGTFDSKGLPTYGLRPDQIKAFEVLDLKSGRVINNTLDTHQARLVPGTTQETLLDKARRYVDDGDRLKPDGITRRMARRVLGRQGERLRLSGRRPKGVSSWVWNKVSEWMYPWNNIQGQRPMSGIIGDAHAAGGALHEAYLDVYLSDSPAGKKHLVKILENEIKTLKEAHRNMPGTWEGAVADDIRQARAFSDQKIKPLQALINNIENMKNIDDIVHEEIRLAPARLEAKFNNIVKGLAAVKPETFRRAMSDEQARLALRRLGGGEGVMRAEIPEKVWYRAKITMMTHGASVSEADDVIAFLKGAIASRSIGEIRAAEEGISKIFTAISERMEPTRKVAGKVYGALAVPGAALAGALNKGLWGLGFYGTYIDTMRGLQQDPPMSPVHALTGALIMNFIDITGTWGIAMGFDTYRNPSAVGCRSSHSYLSILRTHTDNFRDLEAVSDAENDVPDVFCFNWMPFTLRELDIPYFEATDIPEEEKEERRGFLAGLSSNPMDAPAVMKRRVNPRLEYELIYNKLKESTSLVPKFEPGEDAYQVMWMGEDALGDSLYHVARRDYFLERWGEPISEEEYIKNGKKRISSKRPILTPEEYYHWKVTGWWKDLVQEQLIYLHKNDPDVLKRASPEDLEKLMSVIEHEKLSKDLDIDGMVLFFRSAPNGLLYETLIIAGEPGDPFKFGGKKEKNAKLAYAELRIRADWNNPPIGYDIDQHRKDRSTKDGLSAAQEKAQAIQLLRKYHEEFRERARLETIVKQAGVATEKWDKPKEEQLISLNRLRRKLKSPPVMFFVASRSILMTQLLSTLQMNGPKFTHGDLNGQIVGGGEIDLNKFREQIQKENLALPGERTSGSARKKYLSKINPGRVIFIPVKEGTDLESLTTQMPDPFADLPAEQTPPESLRRPDEDPEEKPTTFKPPFDPSTLPGVSSPGKTKKPTKRKSQIKGLDW